MYINVPVLRLLSPLPSFAFLFTPSLPLVSIPLYCYDTPTHRLCFRYLLHIIYLASTTRTY